VALITDVLYWNHSWMVEKWRWPCSAGGLLFPKLL